MIGPNTLGILEPFFILLLFFSLFFTYHISFPSLLVLIRASLRGAVSNLGIYEQ